MNAVEQEDLPGALGQGTQGGLDTLQVVVDLHGLLRGLGQARLAHRHSGFGYAFAATFAAQVVYGQVARATQQVSVQRLDLDLGATPETKEQFLDQVRSGGAAADPTAYQRLHTRTLGLEHLDETCTCACAVSVRLDDIPWLAHGGHTANTASIGPSTTLTAARPSSRRGW